MPKGIYNRKNRRTREADLGLGRSVAEVTEPTVATRPVSALADEDPNLQAVRPAQSQPSLGEYEGETESRVAAAAPPKPPRRTRRRRARRGKRQTSPRDMSNGIAEGLAQVLKNFEAQNLQHLQQQIKHLEGRLSAVEQAGTSFRDTMIAGLNRH